MRKVTKLLGLGAAVAVAGTIGWQAFAQTPMHSGPQGMGPGMMMGMGAGHGPMAGGFGDPTTRLATLKSELEITPQQQPAWDAYAKTVEDAVSTMRAQHHNVDMTALHNMLGPDRQAFMTQMWDQHDQAFQTVKAAADKLLTTLDDTQKTKAKELLPGLAAFGPGMMQHTGFGGPMMQQGELR